MNMISKHNESTFKPQNNTSYGMIILYILYNDILIINEKLQVRQ